MMNEMNLGWGMGFGYGWIIGIIVLVVLVWFIVKSVNHKNNSTSKKKINYGKRK